MHIPDGYLSPATCGVLFAVDIPVWASAGRRVRKVVKNRYVPLLAIGAAYCFLTMMFNVPIPDGTTAHAVGAVLVAVLLGPYAAIIAVGTALAIQALFFGDGGVLAYGANCFNMAIVMTLVGYGAYRLVARGSTLTSPRRALAAGIGGYVGLNAAALCAAVELGLQPVLFHRADGTPLYAPFHLAQALPPMMLAHLSVAGVVELALTAGIVGYLQRANVALLRVNHANVAETDADRAGDEPPRGTWRPALIGLAVLGALTPLGLIAPGSAFGEGGTSSLDLKRYHLDALPSGLRHYAGFWHHSLFSGYDFSHDKHPAIGYLLSALVGVVAIAAALFAVLGARRLVKRRRAHRRMIRAAT